MGGIKCSTLSVLAGFMAVSAMAGDAALSREFKSADKINWGPDIQNPTPAVFDGHRADYRMEIPATGWYELLLESAGTSFRHDLLVDGKHVWRFRAPSQLDKSQKVVKAGNLWLEKGQRVISLQRLGRTSFPTMIPKGFELRPAEGRPEASVTADKTLVDIVRAREKLIIKVTGGGQCKDVTYELLRKDLMDKDKPSEVVGEVEFDESDKPDTRTVKIPCPVEGAFSLGARIKGGKDMLQSEFPIGQYAVVDVGAVKAGSGKTVKIHDIDCVKQTDNGQPLPGGVFFEANGPTRVVTTAAGTYRESHDSSAPLAEPMTSNNDPHSYSAFSYIVGLPEEQVPYLVDIEFPDDTRRKVAIYSCWIDEQNGGFKGKQHNPNNSYGKAYQTGGDYPIRMRMCHHRFVVWAGSKTLALPIISQEPGTRAAASRITITRFADDLLPATKAETTGGRTLLHWYEEGKNWRMLINPPTGVDGLVESFLGIDRWARICRYYGANAMSACGVSYQGLFWRSTTLRGYMNESSGDFDQCRLMALICEKYGMRYMPEIFATQGYFHEQAITAAVGNKEDAAAFSCHGVSTNRNPLHPAVQKLMIDGLGELADKLVDCKSYSGMQLRSDGWLFNGYFHFASIHWGYGDWIIREFEKHSGVKVPGAAGDPNRFAQRYEFLTSKDMKDKWIAWRCGRILDYHKRLSERIQGGRADVRLALRGATRIDAELYPEPKTDDEAERVIGIGVDLRKYCLEPGLGRFGGVDSLVHKGQLRGCIAGFGAQELATAWPAEKLGIKSEPRKSPYSTSIDIPAGVNSLAQYAAALAEQDVNCFQSGCNSDPYGDQEIWHPWFSEYEALPAAAFDPLPSAIDPVAVWSKQVDGDFFFYAVNREEYPATVELDLNGVGKLVRIGTGQEVKLDGGKLKLDLPPYGLAVFKAKSIGFLGSVTGMLGNSGGIAIKSAMTTVPPERIEAVRSRLGFAQEISESLSGANKGAVSAEDEASFRKKLAEAWQAFTDGHYWRARTALASPAAKNVYNALAKVPDWQFNTKFPRMLTAKPNEGHWLPTKPLLKADELSKLLAPGTTATLKDSSELNPDWLGAKVVHSEQGKIEFDLPVPGDAAYSLRIGQAAPALGLTIVSVNGAGLANPAITSTPGSPETAAFPPVSLKAGKARVTLERRGPFGVYALQLLPKLKPITNPQWSTVGYFDVIWNSSMPWDAKSTDALKQGFDKKYPPEEGTLKLDAAYKTDDGREVRWSRKTDSIPTLLDDTLVPMRTRTGSPGGKMNFAVTYINSDADRDVVLCLGVEWWAIAYINGARILTNITPQNKLSSGGADFQSWYPNTGTMRLKKGQNTLMMKLHGGSFDSFFSAFISDIPGVTCSATPESEK